MSSYRDNFYLAHSCREESYGINWVSYGKHYLTSEYWRKILTS